LHVDGQIGMHGKAIAKTPLKLNMATRKETPNALAFSEQNWGSCTQQYYISVAKCSNASLKETVTMANGLTSSTLELSEDGSFQGDQMAEELAAAASQCMGICKLTILSHKYVTNEFNRNPPIKHSLYYRLFV